MIVLEISTVALSTEAAMRFEQSWGLFCRSSRTLGGMVTSASRGAVVLGVLESESVDEAGLAAL
jgi:hypothetical protein